MAMVGSKSHGLKGLLRRENGTSKSRNASSSSLVTADMSQSIPPKTTTASVVAPEPEERPPTPPPKDTPSTPQPLHSHTYSVGGQSTISEADSHHRPYPLSRAESLYSLSRLSFSSQISQLTSIQLPQASTISSSIASIQTATLAAQVINETATQIQTWMRKASDVLDGLDAADDVEWASAAGKEGLDEVDQAISRFESLVLVIISSVEFLQRRKDASQVPVEEMRNAVNQVESIALDWRNIKSALSTVKKQVELAIEWEALSDKTFVEIGTEIRNLSKFIFELEERRHLAAAQSSLDSRASLDLDDLKNIVEESPSRVVRTATLVQRLKIPDIQQGSFATDQSSQEDLSLFELSARLQPLRANLDFLPMKIAVFKDKAVDIFPSACTEFENDRQSLEQQWERLDADAEALRRELGEDKWVIVFRTAAKQALKMIESVTRSVTKVDESLSSNTQLHHAPGTSKKIESYEAKKQHYCPAIESVLGIVEKGMRDKLTVNGEIVRLHSEIQKRWKTLQLAMKNLDSILREYNTSIVSSKNNQQQQLRDSISLMLSPDKTTAPGSILTPGSSPLSSVGLSRKPSSQELEVTPSKTVEKAKPPSGYASAPGTTLRAEKRYSSLPIPSYQKSPGVNLSSSLGPQPRKGSNASSTSTTVSPRMSRYNPKIYTPPVGKKSPAVSSTTSTQRPRWNISTNVQETPLGQNRKGVEASPNLGRGTPFTPKSTIARRSVSQNFPPSLQTLSAPKHRSPLTPGSASRPVGGNDGASESMLASSGWRYRGSSNQEILVNDPATPSPPSSSSRALTGLGGSNSGRKLGNTMIPVPTPSTAVGSSRRASRFTSVGSISIHSRGGSVGASVASTDGADDDEEVC